MTSGGDILISVGADTARFHAAMSSVESTMKSTTNSIGRMGMRLGLGLVAAGTGAGVMAYHFEESMQLLRTSAGASQAEVNKMSKAVIALSKTAQGGGQGPKKLADALYFIESSGIRGGAALKVLSAAAVNAGTTGADLTEVTKALTSAVKVHIKGTESQTKAMGTLNAIVGAGKMTMQDLTGALSTGILPAAKNVGISLSQMGAAIDTMTIAGIPAQQAATKLTATFLRMMSPTKAASGALKNLGLGSSDLANALSKGGLTQALGLLVQKYKETEKSSGEVFAKQQLMAAFGRSRGGAAIMALVEGYNTYNASLKQVNATTGDYVANSAAAMERAPMKIKVAFASLQGSMTQVGGVALPMFARLATSISSVVDWLGRHKTVTTALFVAVSSLATGMIAFSYGTRIASAAIMVYTAMTAGATAETVGLGVAMRATGIGAIVGLAAMAVGALLSFKLAASATAGVVDALTQSVRNYKTSLDDARSAESAFRNGSLSLKSAQLSLKESIVERTRVDKDATSTALQRARADLTVKQNEQAVKDQQDQVVTSAKGMALAHQKASFELRNMSKNIAEASSAVQFYVSKGGNAKQATEAFSKGLASLAKEAGGSTTAAGRAALAVLKLTEGMHKVPKPGDIKAAGIFEAISKEAQKESAKTTTVVSGIGPKAHAAAVGLGSSIKGGVLAGASGFSGALAARMTSEINAALASAKASQGAKSPSTVWRDKLGKPLGEGVVVGFLLGSGNLNANVTDRVRSAMEKAQTAVQSMQGVVSTAFGNVADKAMSAFDAKTEKMISKLKVNVSTAFGAFTYAAGGQTPGEIAAAGETPAEQTLREETAARDDAARAQALADATASGDLRAVSDAQWAIRQAALQAQATQERTALVARVATEKLAADTALASATLQLQAKRDLEKEHLEAQLAQLEKYLAKHPEEYKKVHAKILKLFKVEFGPKYKEAGENLGKAFATGLQQSFKALGAAAKQFAEILEKYLKLQSPAKVGPLSSINTWWTALPDTLLSGVDMSKTGAYIAGGVDASLSAAPRSIGSGGLSGGGGNTTINITVPVSNAFGDDPKAVALKVRNHLVELVRSGQIPNVGLA